MDGSKPRIGGPHSGTCVAAIVGIDGCGKTSTFRDAISRLAELVPTAGVSEIVLHGGPGSPPVERMDIPLSRSARTVAAAAKGLRRPSLYKDLKILEFVERTHVRDHLLAREPPTVLLTDGDPLVNVAAWAVARYSREELRNDDARLLDALHYLAGDRLIPVRQLPYYLHHGWQLALLNRLHLARFGFPDLVFLLEIDPEQAMTRIQDRGRPLQSHENVEFLSELGRAYERVCRVLEADCAVRVVRIRVGQTPHDDVVRMVTDAALDVAAAPSITPSPPGTIDVIATTMSGSFEDQRKVDRIGAALSRATRRPIRVHRAATHAEAERLANAIVAAGGRTLVSAGGAGTFNAVLEGCHLGGNVPEDVRIGFLRKGSADLIGKVLDVPDDLELAADAIIEGVEADRLLPADILTVAAIAPDGGTVQRHMIGFGGTGIFGDVPRFTETRLIKYYKGLLGTWFGDLGPFFVGLLLASMRWLLLRLFGRITPATITLDGVALPAERWAAVIVMNGDLGSDFPLGRGLPLSSGTFRVIALRYRGMRMMLRQILACRTASLLAAPDEYAATVVEVKRMLVEAERARSCFMVNVDGLKLLTHGQVQVAVSGRVGLIRALPRDTTATPRPAVGV